MKRALSEEQEAELGAEIARVLKLKEAKHDDGSSRGKKYTPRRWDTTHGTKTDLGLYRTIQGLVDYRQSE